jgi:hypothetical protein
MRSSLPKKLYVEDVSSRTGVEGTTWRAYVARGQAPHPQGRDIINGRAQPWWEEGVIDHWIAGRPGPGRRSRSQPVIYFIQAEDGRTIGDPDLLPAGQYGTGLLLFNPPNSDLPFAGQTLTVRFGAVPEPPTNPALSSWAHITLADGSYRRLRPTLAVQDELFGT